jgi:purine-nucleoside phosphorylase
MQQRVQDAATAIREREPNGATVGLILGSGLGALGDELTDATAIAFQDVPGFPQAHVVGHAGRLVLGELAGVRCVALQGRFHMYEGHDAATVALPTRVMIELGVRTLIVTNAAGGINRSFRAGDLMLIDDHINLMCRNPLIGPVVDGDTRFPDMSQPYDAALQRMAEDVAREQKLRLVRGVYAAVLGPSYETAAEIRMLERMGADAIGMSTVPEVIVARARGARVLGISLISNAAAGISATPLSHAEVVEAGREASGRFAALVRGVLQRIATEAP